MQQQRRSTGAGRGRSRSSSIGSMLEPRSRRGERFIGLCAVRTDHDVEKMVTTSITARRENRLSGAPNAANASEESRADSCRQVFPSPPLC